MIISIINNKGGVGKTALSCNLGASLARLNKEILVIDNDPQCNTSSNLLQNNLNHQKTLYELINPKNNKVTVDQCIYPSPYQKSLYCIPNVRATSGLDMELIAIYPESLSILKDKIKNYVEKSFDFTLIDTPPNIGIFTTIALCASQFVIVPIDASSADSLDGLNEALNLIESIKKTENPDLKFFRLLINRVHGHKTICKVIINDIHKKFQEKDIFKTTIPENTSLQQAVYLNETIFKHDRTSRAAKSFRNLGKEFLEIIKEK